MDNNQKIGIVVVVLIVAAGLIYYFYYMNIGSASQLADVPLTVPIVPTVGNGSLFVPPPKADERPVEEIMKTLAKYSLVGVTGYDPTSGGMTAREVVSLSKCQNSCSMDPNCTGIMYSMPNDYDYPQGSCFTINIPINDIPLAPADIPKEDKGKYARMLYKRV